MAQIYTSDLNRTIEGVGFAPADSPPSSLSVRLTVSPDSYVKIYGIEWGLRSAAGASIVAIDLASLVILRNEIFDPAFNYAATVGAAYVKRDKVAWWDAIIGHPQGTDFFRHRNFRPALRLEGALDWLIIMPCPANLSGNEASDVVLTVRGKRCSRTAQVRERAMVELHQRVYVGGEED